MKPLRKIFQLTFGCSHSKLSRVFTIKKRTYRVCFECGHEVEYSWELMRASEPPVAVKYCAPRDNTSRVRVSAA